MEFNYKPQNICPNNIKFTLNEDGTITNVSFTGGCNGNLKAVSRLVEGMPAEKVIELLKGNTCGKNFTSCADQLAIAVANAIEEAKKQLSGEKA